MTNLTSLSANFTCTLDSLSGDGGGGYLSSSASSSLLNDLASFTGLNLGAPLGVGGMKETVWLCKICGEEREMWRKSGAWFFKVGRTHGYVVNYHM